MATDVDKLRRLRVLQRLALVAPNPMGEVALLRELQADMALNPTVVRVRHCIEYLSEWQLVQVVRVEGCPWLAAHITDMGRDWLNDPSDRGFCIYSPGELPDPVADNRRGQVSSIEVLPLEVKTWLDQELVTRNFTDYRGIAGLLAQRGYEISKSAVGRYGKKFKQDQKKLRQSIEMARAFAEVVGDDGAAMNQTLTALAQQELMAVIREGEYDEDIDLPDLVKSIAALNRSDINTRKFQIEQAARKHAIKQAADQAVKTAKSLAVSEEAIKMIRRDVLHMAD